MNTTGYPGQFFAVYPLELPLRCIRIGTSERGCCPKCGAQWARVLDRSPSVPQRIGGDANWHKQEYGRAGGFYDAETTLCGWRPTCKCEAGEPIGCTILDPFVGSGTTLIAARMLGHKGIGIDTDCSEAIKRLTLGDAGVREDIELEKLGWKQATLGTP